jgi:hypothetical protein
MFTKGKVIDYFFPEFLVYYYLNTLQPSSSTNQIRGNIRLVISVLILTYVYFLVWIY